MYVLAFGRDWTVDVQKLRPGFSMHMARLSLRPPISAAGEDLLRNESNIMNSE